jgi:hypothetical protein
MPETPSDGDWPPPRPISPWGLEAARDLAEIKQELKELRREQGVTTGSSQQNGWEISELKRKVEALTVKLDRVGDELPDLRRARVLVFGLVGVILAAVAGAALRGIHWG